MFQIKSFKPFLLLQNCQYILEQSYPQAVYELFFSCNYSFYSLDIHQHQDLSHSQLQGFQIDSLSHTPLLINSLHSHLHLSSFHHCLLLQTLASNLHSHVYISCHSMCLVSLVLGFRLNTFNI